VLADALNKVMSYAASGELGLETETVPLADVEAAWNREQSGRRIVVIP
jgi:NADPH2:quinone reductase